MGHTLVDASSGSGSVLIVNPNAEVVVLPGCTCIGKLLAVAAISVAMEDPGLPNDTGISGRQPYGYDMSTLHIHNIYIYIHFKLYLCTNFKLYLGTHESYVECRREIN